MRLKVLGSSSFGNCYLLIGKTETLILEAGLPCKEILKGLNHDTPNVVGCCVSHLHGDHFKGANDLSKRFIEVYGNLSVINKLGTGTLMDEKKITKIGEFKVFPLSVKHDVENYAFVISHPEMGQLLFCTDAASFPYNIKGVNHLLMEANYCDDIQQEYMLNNFDSHNNIDRLRNSHLSLDQTKEIVERHNGHHLQTIMLLHLSSRNSDGDYFKTEVQKTCGKPVNIAMKGLVIEL